VAAHLADGCALCRAAAGDILDLLLGEEPLEKDSRTPARPDDTGEMPGLDQR
jgi:hypothetical protein